MRSLRLAASASLGLSAALLFGGCNAIFGLDTVTQGAPVSGSTSGGGGEGGGSMCPGAMVANNLIVNPSFEKNSAWQTAGQGLVFDYTPADDCTFACGARVGHLGFKPGMGTGSVSLYQDVSRTFELGSTLVLSARYRYMATNSPYFGLAINGYDVGMPYIHGMNDGDHFTVDKVEVPVLDPRRTGGSLRASLLADYDDAGLDASVDCLALTYTPPPGQQVLQNGWFDGSAGTWFALNGASLTWDNQGGLCGSGAAHVAVAANQANAEIRSTTVNGPWPAGTTFHVGAAVKPLPDTGSNNLDFFLQLYVAYDDSGDPPSDVLSYAKTAGANSEAWFPLVGDVVTTRPVKGIGVWIGGASTATAGEFLADCASLRAILPP
jgi:hypothetical protein